MQKLVILMTDKTTLKYSETENSKEKLNNLLSSKKKELRFVGVLLPLDIFHQLEEIAREEERSLSQVIRLAIRKYLKERRNAEAKE